jgi:hypothetical protein
MEISGMKTFAILVGINAYKHDELTASVSDAVKMRAGLIKSNIAQEGDCVLLTAPLAEGAADLPTRKVLSKRLSDARENGGNYDRLIVFFSGHGEMTFSDADQSRPRTVILPVDYEGDPTERFLNIDVDELLDLYRLAGPKEQIFIFDCCRKQAPVAGKGAGGGALLWPATTTGAETAQAVLYGVSLKGVAHAKKNDLGLMTKHIIAALGRDSKALDYLVERDLFGVTVETLTEYVKNEVRTELESSGFEANYDLPTLVPRGPRTSPLLTKQPKEVPPRSLTVVIEPPDAIPVANVSLLSGGNSLHTWPPNNVPFKGAPTQYGIRSSVTPNLEFLPPEPAFDTVDIRRTSQRVVKFRHVGSAPEQQRLASPALIDEREDVMERFELRHTTSRPKASVDKSRIVASAQDRFTFVEVVGLQPPFEMKSGFVQSYFEVDVEPGLYDIRFKLGPEVYSRTNVEASPGRVTFVEATAGASPLIFETMPERFTNASGFTPTGQISESIGDLQGGVAATLLPALAMRPFDRNDQFLSHFPVDIRVPQEMWPERPLSVVVGIDGDLRGRKPSWHKLFKGCTLTVHSVNRHMQVDDKQHASVPLRPLANETEKSGFYRLANAITEAPSASFMVTLESNLLPFPISIFAASLPRRVTALSILIVPDKSFDVSINVLQYPDEADRDEAGNPSGTSFPRKLRMLQIAQRLFASKQLYGRDEYLDLLWFKWLDPIVGVMAMLELLRSPEEQRRLSTESMTEAAHNLRNYFGDLPDAKVVAALQCPLCRREVINEFRTHGGIPVLAECVRHLAILLNEDTDGRVAEPSELDRLASRLQLGQPWSITTSIGDF